MNSNAGIILVYYRKYITTYISIDISSCYSSFTNLFIYLFYPVPQLS